MPLRVPIRSRSHFRRLFCGGVALWRAPIGCAESNVLASSSSKCMGESSKVNIMELPMKFRPSFQRRDVLAP